MKDVDRSFISGASGISRWLGSVARTFGDVWFVWMALVVVTSVPYLVANLRTPPGHVFTGVLSAYDDTFTYFAWIKQSADGIFSCVTFTHPNLSQPNSFFHSGT